MENNCLHDENPEKRPCRCIEEILKIVGVGGGRGSDSKIINIYIRCDIYNFVIISFNFNFQSIYYLHHVVNTACLIV
jgi:hypothetical protein